MNRLKIKLLTMVVICFLSTGAFAQAAPSSIPGCNPDIRDIIKNYAEAKVAYEVAVIDELLTKPRSVLNMICFKDSLKKSAESSSLIFSGNFFDKIEKFIDDSLQAHLANYSGDDVPGVLDSSGVCSSIGDVVAKQDSLLVKFIPSFEDALSDDLGATGTSFKKSWDASKKQNIFSNLEDKRDDLFAAVASPIAFSKIDTTCEVLEKAGLVGVSCD